MNCLSPILLTKPNLHYVPCGKCPACLAKKRQEWSFRLRFENQACVKGFFITLTYNDLNLPPGGVNKRDCQLFLKRLRKKLGDRSFRYFIVAEYGDTTYRQHYHMLLFLQEYRSTDFVYNVVNAAWDKGFTYFGDIEDASIHYCTKYCMKQVGRKTKESETPVFTLMSRNPGIGFNYVNRMKDYHINSSNVRYVMCNGDKSPMPRYFRDKIRSDLPDDVLKYLEIRSFEDQDRKINQLYSYYVHKFKKTDFDSFIAWYKERVKIKNELIEKHVKKQKL